jgi:GNAT superfamily N-acetyltransferase
MSASTGSGDARAAAPEAAGAPPFVIRDYAADDEARVLALLRDSLGTGRAFERSTAFWRWKHVQNAFGHSLLLLAANGDLYGLRAFMRWRFRTGAGTLAAVRAVDTATNPNYRRLGVFSKLTNAAIDRARGTGVDLIFNTPNQYSLPGYLKLGWTLVGRPRLLVRLLRPFRIVASLARRRSEEGETHPETRASSHHGVERLLEHREALGQLLRENDAHFGDRIRTDRSEPFIGWRYASSPELPYGAAWVGARPDRAAIIYRPNHRRGLREIMVVDLLVGREGVRAARDAVQGLIRSVDAADADYLVASARPGSTHWRALRRAGFLSVPRIGPNLTVRPLSAAAEGQLPTQLDRWELSLGDLEVF